MSFVFERRSLDFVSARRRQKKIDMSVNGFFRYVLAHKTHKHSVRTKNRRKKEDTHEDVYRYYVSVVVLFESGCLRTVSVFIAVNDGSKTMRNSSTWVIDMRRAVPMIETMAENC